MHKIHPWPTRRNPLTGRYEALIAGEWRSRQYAWQLLRRMDRKCSLCGREPLRADYPLCRRCARKQSILKVGKWEGPWREGKRGRRPKSPDYYSKFLPMSTG